MARIKTEGGGRRVGAAGKRGRRKWSVGEKARIVQEVERTGAAVSEIARRHGAHTSMLMRWRAQYRAGQLGANGLRCCFAVKPETRKKSGAEKTGAVVTNRDGPRGPVHQRT